MNKVLNIATQCNTRLKLKALQTICITLIVLTVLVGFVIAMALNTIANYREVSAKIDSSSVNVELDLNK